jgi:phage baseplate assembly protein W
MNINIKFPLTDDISNHNFLKTNENTVDAIKSNLYLLFTTDVGTRFYNRGYGSNLRKFIFDQNDNLTELDIENEIKNIVSKKMSKINVDMVTFDDESTANSLLITIYFTYSDSTFSFSDVIGIQF